MTEKTGQAMTNTNMVTKELFTTKNLVMMAFLGAIAYVLMLLHLPFKYLGFLEVEFSDVPALVGGIFYGPMVGLLVELIKNLIKAITATTTGGVGELANFVICSAYVVTASYLFRRLKGKARAVISFGVATVALAFVGAIINYFITVPLYAQLFGGMENVVGSAAKTVPAVKDLATVVLLGITPFNVMKGIVLGVIGFYLYKPLRNRI
ncbi:ECF transporter S component [Anaerosporobacter faecicola]|uniref:ECF transporter S component n=1 Tax=Anaerosporobacter faecicola TaxID=2718714 RepID=UPI00143A33A8|nr:ECF transporter S component [Anaerosporobacter faecicola]